MAKISPGIRSETADDSPLFTLSTKPRFYPESRDLPIITARQEIFSEKRGGGGGGVGSDLRAEEEQKQQSSELVWSDSFVVYQKKIYLLLYSYIVRTLPCS